MNGTRERDPRVPRYRDATSIRMLANPCASCGAKAGDWCISKAGRAASRLHAARHEAYAKERAT